MTSFLIMEWRDRNFLAAILRVMKTERYADDALQESKRFPKSRENNHFKGPSLPAIH